MKLFIDSANIDEIREAAGWGIIDGVTTNPSLVAKEGKTFKELIIEICNLVNGPVSAEVTALKADEMMQQAREYAKWHKNVVVKLPMTEEGIKALSRLSKEGIKINMTLVFSANQALLCAKGGAFLVSPFIGRLDDVGEDGMLLIKDIVQIYKNYGYKAQVLAASIRHPVHVLQAAKAGADVATCPFKVLKQLFLHPLTDIGLKKFMDDWAKAKK